MMAPEEELDDELLELEEEPPELDEEPPLPLHTSSTCQSFE